MEEITQKSEKKLTVGKLKEVLTNVPDDVIVNVELSDSGQAEAVYLASDEKVTSLYIVDDLSDGLSGTLLSHYKTVTKLYCAWEDNDL